MSGAASDTFLDESVGDASASSNGEDGTQDGATAGDGLQTAVPAAGVINQTMPLEVVAQQESTRSYFLAQTLESTKTVPIVSANLPLDTSVNQGPQAGADGGITVGSEDKVTDGDPSVSAEGDGSSEDEGGDDSDESDLGASDGAAMASGVSSESTVVGSFIYRGITYAVEPGGESVAVVAADYAKLPSEFIDAQTMVLPSMVTSDGADYYTVSRIADNAFSGLIAAAAQNGQDATDESAVSITTMTIPASIVEIGDDALAGFDTLLYVVVSPDNPVFGSYDGCLYDADLSSLRLIPGGRLGAVHIAPSAVEVADTALSHCAGVTTFIADEDSAASQLLQENDFHNANGDELSLSVFSGGEGTNAVVYQRAYSDFVSHEENASADLPLSVIEERAANAASYVAGGSCRLTAHSCFVNWVIPTKSFDEVDLSKGADRTNYWPRTGGWTQPSVGSQGSYSWGIHPDYGFWFGTGGTFYICVSRAGDDMYYGIFETYNNSGGVAIYRTGAYYTSGSFDATTTGPCFEESTHNIRQIGFPCEWDADGGSFGSLNQIAVKTNAPDPGYKKGYTFKCWRNAADEADEVSPGEAVEVPKTGIKFVAVWEPNSYAVTFDSNLHMTNDQLDALGLLATTVVAKDDPERFTYDAPIPDTLGGMSSDIVARNVKGYVFDGYYDRPFDGKQYYDENGNAVRETVEIDGEPVTRNILWDKADDVADNPALNDECTLYAHWKYRIYLNLNTYNSDDQLVLNACTSANGETGSATLNLPALSATQAALQSELLQKEASITSSSVSVEGFDAPVSVQTIPYYIETTLGAPVQLPQAQNRTGYDSTFSWGTSRGSCGSAADLLAKLDGATGLVSDDSQIGVPEDYSEGVTLYADWAGKAKSYKVTLQAAYTAPDGTVFAAAASSPTVLDAVYDQPLLASDKATVTTGITQATTAPAYNNGGSTIQNLVFKGYYTTTNNAANKNDPASMPPASSIKYIDAADDGAGNISAVSANNAFRPAGDSTNVTLYALWGYPVVTITYHLQGGTYDASVNDANYDASGDNGMGTFTRSIIASSATPDLSGKKNGKLEYLPERGGYEFTGYWNTRYSEADDAKQFYDADMNRVAPNDTWTSTVGGGLYAHWKYRIYLNLNTYNTDRQLVVALNGTDGTPDLATGGIYRMGAALSQESGFATEQSEVKRDSAQLGSVAIERTSPTEAGATRDVTIERAYIETIFGAPIELPNVTGRVGYRDATSWGTQLGSELNGSAGGTKFPAGTTGENPAVGTPVQNPVTKEYAPVTLYADWSGCAKQYWVQLRSAYDRTDGTDSFAVSPDDAASQYIQVTYDAPIPVQDTTVRYGENGAKTSSSVIVTADVTKDANNAPRNLRLKGYFTDECSRGASAGEQYLGVATDENGAATAVVNDGVKFRCATDDALNELRGIYVNTAAQVTPTLSTPAVVLYAWWGHNTTAVTFDIQGGKVGAIDPFDGAEFTIKTADPVTVISNSFTAAQATVPVRAGYEFAGWWNTPYREGNDFAAGEGSSTTIVPTCYFVADGNAVKPAADGMAWAENADAVLYAHWKYSIVFDKNLEHGDIAEVSTDAVDAAGAGFASRMANLVPPGAEAEKDVYGNAYYRVKDEEGTSRESDTLVIEAIAGAPVELPYAHTRRAFNAATNAYDIETGYRPTREWMASKDTKTNQLSDPVEYDPAQSGWTPAYDPAVQDFPCAITLDEAGAPGYVDATGNKVDDTVCLYAEWKNAAKEYYVQLVSSYAHPSDAEPTTRYTAYENDPVTGEALGLDLGAVIKVTYDQPVPAIAANQIPLGASAEVDGADGTTVYDNLDFSGFYAGRSAIGSPTSVRYLNANGACVGTAPDNCQTWFRLTDFRAETTVAASEAVPIPLYALWSQPQRKVVLNFYDADFPAESTDSSAFALPNVGDVIDATFDLRKGTALQTDAGSSALAADVTAKLADISSFVRASERFEGYDFAGFWTAPYQENAYTEDRLIGGETVEVSVTPVKYFDLQGTALVPTQAVWNEDPVRGEPVVLYAHWKYSIALNANPQKPSATPTDLWNGADDRMWIGQSDIAASNATIVYGPYVFGQAIDLPFDENATEAISRTRMIDGALARTGYTFDGWFTSASLADGTELPAATDFQEAPSTLAPTKGAAGAVTNLYASWLQDAYTVYLRATYDGFVYGDSYLDLEEDHTRVIGGTADVTDAACVRYDEPLPVAITAPLLHGYTFLGYYTTKQAALPSYSDQGDYLSDGVCFYGKVDPNFGRDQLQPAADAVWTSALRTADSTHPGTIGAELYAHYARDAYTANFYTREMPEGAGAGDADADGGIQAVDEKPGFTSTVTGMYYGMPLVDVAFQTPSDATYQRAGYRFVGWYYYAPGTDRIKENRIYAFHRTSTDADSYLAGTYTRNEDGTWAEHGASATVPLWTEEGTPVSFYAAWEPRTYRVTFYTNYPAGMGTNTAVSRTFFYEQMLEGDGAANVPQIACSPYTLTGWFDNAKGEDEVSGLWLFDGQSDDRLVYGGRFMPRGTQLYATDLVFYAQWQAPGKKSITLLSGPHGDIEVGGDLKSSYVEAYGFGSDVDLTKVTVLPDAGWSVRGWIEVPADELELDGSGRLTAEATARINAAEREGTYEYVTGIDTKVAEYRDYFLVAVYYLSGQYSVHLDPAGGKVGDWAGGRGNVTYSFGTEHKDDNGAYVKTEAFALPSITRTGYTFKGWQLQGSATADNPQGTILQPDGEKIDPVVVAAEARDDATKAQRTYVALWDENEYTVFFDMQDGSDPLAVGPVGYTEEIQVPYPATRGGGSYFLYYSLDRNSNLIGSDRYYPIAERDERNDAKPYTVEAVLRHIADNLDDREVQMTEDTLTFFAQWSTAISAVVPSSAVTIFLDPETGDMKTPASSIRATYNRQESAASRIEVASLRYDRLDASENAIGDGVGTHVFDVGTANGERGGAVYLSVYAGLTDSEAADMMENGARLMDKSNGAVTRDDGSTYEPLLIDLAHNAVIPKTSTTPGAQALDADYGFDAFTAAGIPLHYGLVFAGTYRDGGTEKPIDAAYFRNVTRTLPALGQDGVQKAIAHLYYTVQLATA